MLPKPGDSTQASNWRPIAILKITHKAFATILGARIHNFFFVRAPFRLSTAVPVHEYNGLRAESGRWQAACEQGAAPACGEDLVVEVGQHSRIAIVSTRRQLEQRRREGAHGGDSQDAGPALDPSCTCSNSERRHNVLANAQCADQVGFRFFFHNLGLTTLLPF